MDTSETYIKMCDCPEIQDEPLCEPVGDFAVKEIHRLGIGDFVALFYGDWDETDSETKKYVKRWRTWIISENDIVCWAGSQPCFNKESRGLIWLPRQDQLQGMVGVKNVADFLDGHLIMGGYGGEAVLYYLSEEQYRPASMEQLWLAYLMLEKFNKTWNGDKWV